MISLSEANVTEFFGGWLKFFFWHGHIGSSWFSGIIPDKIDSAYTVNFG